MYSTGVFVCPNPDVTVVPCVHQGEQGGPGQKGSKGDKGEAVSWKKT